MHCELIVPALLPGGEDAAAALEGLRLPALELLLARGRRRSDESISLERWLAQAFDLDEDAEVPAGALTFAASGGQPGDFAWMRADPAHLRLNRDALVFVPAVAFGVQSAEAEALAGHLNRHFGGELTFHPLSGERWCVRIEGTNILGLRTEPPAEVAGLDINRHLPSGEGSMRWHGLLNEIQMALHEHPVNEAREARGEPAVNSVWLWGAGRMPAEASAPFQSVTADDPLALGLARAAGLRHRTLPPDAGAWLERLPEDGRQLLVLDTLRLPLALGDFEGLRTRLAELEGRWFAPLVAALKSGRVGMVTVLAPDGAELRAYESTRVDLRHFWRRPKPLPACLA
ncbi:MAG: hypothetical protein JSS40_06085 [Proteobacteria bacterium]|nr:hypothetical protein [Pseudomonadota bacterium]